MSPEKKDNPGHVTRIEFNRRFGKLDLALFGPDGRGGIVKDIGDIKGSMKVMEESRKDEKRSRALTYSIVGGVIVAVFSWVLTAL